MDVIISILDSATETSMPFNEFVIWRAKHYVNQKQILIVCEKKGDLPKIEIPSNVEIIRCEKKIVSIRKSIKNAVQGCKVRRDRYVIHLHHVDSGLWAQLSMFGTGYRNKTLFTTHNTFSGYPFHNKIRSYINGLFAHFVSVVSNSAYAGYPSSLKWLKGKRIIAVQNGVDTERIDKILTNDVQKESRHIVFVYVARMVPVKNHHFLLDVIKQTEDNVCFEFIGSKDPEIVKRIESEGLEDKVVLTGLIPREEVFKKLQKAHFYISPSVLEGLPVSLLEGMYTGLPAIVSDIPQHSEVAADSRVIKLLPLEIDTWRSNINQLATMKKEDVEEWGRLSREYIRENFSLERMHLQYDEIYEKIFQL